MNIIYGNIKIKRSVIHEPEGVPSLETAINVQNQTDVQLSEDEGLFIGYGFRRNAYPYENQNSYSELLEDEVKTIVLENDHLLATFLPEYGGRLWSLIDKETKRNLLYTNDVISHRNMAIRNAWFSGGVEWNISSIGHTFLTNEPLYVSEVTDDDGKQYLRMYAYEKLRGVTYQMDFWLYEKQLMCRFRIDNRKNEMVPMYWWSNIAVPEHSGGRVIAPASKAYKSGDCDGIIKVDYPMDQGNDMSFYNHIPYAVDYFFDIDQAQKKFIAHVDQDGFGLLQFSSNRLKGRKLFSWGHNQGARNWQDFLTDKAGDYIEIQAGLAKTQYECLPMPPATVWEWMESYSKLKIDPSIVSGDFATAVNVVNSDVEHLSTQNDLDRLVIETKSMAKRKGKLVMAGGGDGALECMLPNHRLADHLYFEHDQVTDSWQYFIKNGCFPESSLDFVPDYFPYGETLLNLLEKSTQDQGLNQSLPWYYLGIMYYDKQLYKDAYKALNQSLFLEKNAYTHHGLAFTLFQLHSEEFSEHCLEAITMMANNYALIESLVKLLVDGCKYDQVLSAVKVIQPEFINNRLKMYLAMAHLRLGEIDVAEAILYENGGLIIQDMREGELSLSTLWEDIQAAKNGSKSAFGEIPKIFDFRMN